MGPIHYAGYHFASIAYSQFANMPDALLGSECRYSQLSCCVGFIDKAEDTLCMEILHFELTSKPGM